MGAGDLLFVTMSHNVSFMGKTWWVLMLGLRLLVLLLAGFSLFGDEHERFVCNTLQTGCSNVCFDAAAPVSVLRLWLVHLVLLCLPHALFAAYVVHKVAGFYHSGSSRELPERPQGAPSFHCAYFLVVLLRVLLEAAFGAGQFFLFGLSVPKRFLCYEAPCASGVECYVSRPTEKTVMLNFMLAVASLSVLLSLADLASTAKASVSWRRRQRRRREMLMEEMSKGEQSSMLTTTTTATATTAEHGAVVPNGDALRAKVKDESKYAEVAETYRPPTPARAPAPTHFVLHSHLRPPLGRRPDGAPGPRTPTPHGRQKAGAGPGELGPTV
ncbi:LOW QUALITY PROTEIN: gap junction delta-4 protein-like [Clinocottus analis]|uniref:LOW QUALITY PROTEIN: gap junction delta-4 protein-like n=1 Tax=Clinocottus analis TaxID=304258 RepID=UPI0035C20F76